MSVTLDKPTPPSPATVAARAPGVRGLARDPGVLAAFSAFWRSRLLIWAAGCGAFVAFGAKASIRNTFDPFRVTSHYGWLGNVLAAPAVRWDSLWYLGISHLGYRSLQPTGFFPLYPLLIHVVSWVTVSDAVAGVLISAVGTMVGLVVVHRLTELELGRDAAGRAVKLLAFAPFAFYLSAVYTEGLFLGLSAGTFYAARRGRWALAGLLGGLAAATRVTGVLLIVPVILLFLYGPRGDTSAPAGGVGAGWWRPRYRPSLQLLWSLLIPAGLGAFCTYTALRGFGLFATFDAQHTYWAHRFTGPLTGVANGFTAAWHEIVAMTEHLHSNAARGPQLFEACVLVLCALGIVGIFRRLPPAYGAYVLLGLLVPLSSPTLGGEPLKGLDRYASMMFPLFMWVAAWAAGRRRERALLVVFAILLVGFTVQFATWRFVGTSPI